MPKIKKKCRLRAPLPIAKAKVRSQKHGRVVTSQYHKLTARRDAARSEGRTEDAEAAEAVTCPQNGLQSFVSCCPPALTEVARLFQAKLAEMGGVDAYQEASAVSTALHSTSKWVVKTMRARGLTKPPSSNQPKPRVLEVGAINTQLLDCRSLEVRALDLNSRCPRIEQTDFLDCQCTAAEQYDAVVCSMVLNCVPDAPKRGRMLQNIRAHLKVGGLAFIVLPRTCLEHSFHIDRDFWLAALAAVGLTLDHSHNTNKLCFFICIAGADDRDALERFRHRPKKGIKGPRLSAGADFNIEFNGCGG